jgi:hypothetical protein
LQIKQEVGMGTPKILFRQCDQGTLKGKYL